MIIVLQVAAGVVVLLGLVTIAFGVPVKEFSFGNTLILVGTIGVCTGMITLGLSIVAWELRMATRRLAASRSAPEPRAKAALPPFPAAGVAAAEGGFPVSRDQPAPSANAGPAAPPMTPPASSPPWQEDGTSRSRQDASPASDAIPPAPPPKPPRRNLLFASNLKKERELQARPDDTAGAEVRPPPAAPPAPETGEAPPPSFDDAWPKADRARPEGSLPRRGGRAASETGAGGNAERPASPPRPDDAPAVTVLKSGVVDGMAYSLYSDGSIEAQMPEGMMRFASIDDLRAHLDQRP